MLDRIIYFKYPKLARLLAPIEADLIVLQRFEAVNRAERDRPVRWILFRRVIRHDFAPRFLPQCHQRVVHRFVHLPGH